jgi:DNA polymerase I-like protein with 3'-5' exonuclease and polymerase domains
LIHFITQPGQIPEALAALKEPLNGAYALDTETTGLDPLQARVRLLQISNGTNVVVVDVWAFDHTIPAPFQTLLEGPETKILQNAGFDWRFLRANFGVVLGGSIWDTALAERVLTVGSTPAGKSRYASLKRLAMRYLNRELDKSLQTSDWSQPNLSMDQIRYSAEDVLVLHPIQELQQSKLVEADLMQAFLMECGCVAPVNDLNLGGICVDVSAAHRLQADIEDEADRALLDFCESLDAALPDDQKLPRLADGTLNLNAKASGRGASRVPAGFNPNSSTQMATKFLALGYPIPKKDDGNPTLDQNLLAELRADYPLIGQYLDMKGKRTAQAGIEEKILKKLHPVTNRLHAEYDQYGADSGRFTCSKPNMQQIPREARFRKLFVPDPGCVFLIADYSQIELRIAAAIAGEQRMIDAYREGKDLHTLTAALVNEIDESQVTKGQRSEAKALNFGLLYGCGAAKLREQAIAAYGVDMSLEQATDLRNRFFQAYPKLRAWHRRCSEDRNPYVYTVGGHRRLLVGPNDTMTRRCNTPVQGTGSELLKLALIALWSEIQHHSNQARLAAVVHDEIVLSVQQDHAQAWATRLRDCMESAGNLLLQGLVPVVAEVGIGTDWSAK